MSSRLTRIFVVAFGAVASIMALAWGAPAVMAAPLPVPVLIWQFQLIRDLIAR